MNRGPGHTGQIWKESDITMMSVIKWKHFPRYWPFVRGIHRSPVNSPHTGQWRGALMCCLISAWINGWVSNREAGDLRRHRVHYDVIAMRCSDFVHSLGPVSYFLLYFWLYVRLHIATDTIHETQLYIYWDSQRLYQSVLPNSVANAYDK